DEVHAAVLLAERASVRQLGAPRLPARPSCGADSFGGPGAAPVVPRPGQRCGQTPRVPKRTAREYAMTPRPCAPNPPTAPAEPPSRPPAPRPPPPPLQQALAPAALPQQGTPRDLDGAAARGSPAAGRAGGRQRGVLLPVGAVERVGQRFATHEIPAR